MPVVHRLPPRYRLTACLFLALSLTLLAVVGSALYGRAEIVVTTAQRRTFGEFVLTVQDLPFPPPVHDPTVVPGTIVEARVERRQTFAATGPATVGAASATVGSVVVANTTGRDQVLVATTRLYTPERVLLRLKNRVVVPAHGKIAAVVYPDQPEQFPAVAATTRLTIPGLSPALQALIYGEVVASPRSAGGAVPVVTEQDISQAYATLTEALAAEAEAAFVAGVNERHRQYPRLVEREVLKKSSDASAGDRRQTFEASLELRVVTVAFDEVQLVAVVRQHLADRLPFTHALQAVDHERLRYEVQRYDAERREVSLKVAAEGSMVLRADSILLQPATIVGLTRAQIIAHFQRYPEVKQVEVKFFPTRLPRAPRLPSRIKFVVQ